MLITGSCHCRNISFTLIYEASATNLPTRSCTCSFCTKHGALWTTHSSASLKVSVKAAAQLSRYAFGTKTAQFLICNKCGIVPLVVSRIEGHLYAVVNVNTFEDFDVSHLECVSVNFSVEGETARLARRKRSWIANVEYSELNP